MVTDKQLAANRRNALKSTGPRTPEGKARSSQNSTIHGLFSEYAVVIGESKRRFNAFSRELLESLDASGPLEDFLAHSIVCSLWRLARIFRIEREMIDVGIAKNARISSIMGDSIDLPLLGGAYWSDLSDANRFDKLRRYEVSLRRAISRDLHELQRLQASRNGQPAIPPVALDVNVSGLGPESN